ncbi:hypothetical protein [Methylobacterium haplocladii]|uniref:Uncharacterized protein n=1 Tax=Methylobacterium haplocladii TaxID=1176176 RepID=A0A512IS89_9HYPH|nr:hypothetical protein [Methylobacterium haplocladii]GEP00551.1 hypothetical protein MHA02_29380 [Methylobacterium haplocladii]GJD85464.1 hypothetical protein HPGCJGGD_3353 [Methylobacterium haplocladii]GLS57851.1 hypothetical protein GCM10007887_05070 [Methylobacterium haplocladii]
MPAESQDGLHRIVIAGTYGSADIAAERTAEGAVITMGVPGEGIDVDAHLDPKELLRFAEWVLAVAIAHGARP